MYGRTIRLTMLLVAFIAATYGDFDAGLIYAIADVVSLINRIPDPDESGALLINFGSFTVYDDSNDQLRFDLTNPNLNLSAAGGQLNQLLNANEGSLDLDFSGSGLGIIEDESWGLDNITVVPEPATVGLLLVGGLALLRRRR